MVGINSALAWKLILAGETIRKANEALDRIAEAERQLAEAQAEYANALSLAGVTVDDEVPAPEDPSIVQLHHDGAVLLSLVCHTEALEGSLKYGYDLKKAMEYGFRTWAQSAEGRRFMRYARRKLKDRKHH